MNIAQYRVIQAAIANAQDNLYRAELELKRGGDVASSKPSEYIVELKRYIAALQEGLQ
jgi:hypothetical protein